MSDVDPSSLLTVGIRLISRTFNSLDSKSLTSLCTSNTLFSFTTNLVTVTLSAVVISTSLYKAFGLASPLVTVFFFHLSTSFSEADFLFGLKISTTTSLLGVILFFMIKNSVVVKANALNSIAFSGAFLFCIKSSTGLRYGLNGTAFLRAASISE